jgi:hypothetical protein
MPRRAVDFHHDAASELAAAEAWYLGFGTALADAFIFEMQSLVEHIAEDATSFPTYRIRGVRRALGRQFPYALVFTIYRRNVIVLAFSHLRRAPDYWMTRVPRRRN